MGMKDNHELKTLYKEYLEYMYSFEELHGYYRPELSNGQWCPCSFDEWRVKFNDGKYTFEKTY